MKTVYVACCATLAFAVAARATEIVVATNGNDSNPGTHAAPLRTIQRGAQRAQPGDVVTVREGVYRERINPPRGGESDVRRIVYQAAAGEEVEIKGSEVVKTWVKVQDDVWKTTLANAFFGNFNPYDDLIHGDWFDAKGRAHHTGAVYLNGGWLTEAPKLDDVLKPIGVNALWFAKVDRTNTTIWGQFKGVNPNEQLVEINVRKTVFYPEKTGINFITVRGFTMRQAATPWSPPTAEQIGLLGTNWSKGWIIENNVISHSTCAGIALGKYGDQWDNTSADTAEGYGKTIERALAIGWNKESIGHHIVRNNSVSHCEQVGIVGSLGAAFSTVTGNCIRDIHVRQLFSGAEMAGIKFHAAIDARICGNRIFRTCRGLWLDWMAQGTRVSGNLFYENQEQDLFVEVNHGPFLVDNNLFLSAVSLMDMSEGGAYVHNLFTGKIVAQTEPVRATPYHPAHLTALAGVGTIQGGDNRFYNNVFVGEGESSVSMSKVAGTESQQASGFGLCVYDASELPIQAAANEYYNGARPYVKETGSVSRARIDPGVRIEEENDQVILRLQLGRELTQAATMLVTTSLLGKAKISGLPYENADASPLKIDTDYFGKYRNETSPTPGPFENPGQGELTIEVW